MMGIMYVGTDNIDIFSHFVNAVAIRFSLAILGPQWQLCTVQTAVIVILIPGLNCVTISDTLSLPKVILAHLVLTD